MWAFRYCDPAIAWRLCDGGCPIPVAAHSCRLGRLTGTMMV
jgi:hypothetical protein